MRILFVTPYVPSLIRVRPFNFLKRLSERNEVTLVALACGDPSETEYIEEMRRYCKDVHILNLSKVGALARCARYLCSTVPLQSAYTNGLSAQNAVARIAREGIFDVVHVEHIRGAQLVKKIEDVPKIYDSVDCISRLLKQRIERRNGNLIERMIDREELMKMASYEPRIAAGFDRVIITSEVEKRSLEELTHRMNKRKKRVGDVGVVVVRNGVDCNYFEPMDVFTEHAEIVFSGKMSYSPNVSAVLRFYNEVFPQIRWMRPEVRLKIVGSDPAEPVRKLAKDSAVEVTGYVPDIRPHIATARVVVCPLTVGVGIQNKLLEAMAMAKPIVTSSIGYKGIAGARHGKHLLCADDPEDMAKAVLDLLDHPNRGTILGRNALNLVREKYSWDASVRSLESIYAEVAAKPRLRTLYAA